MTVSETQYQDWSDDLAELDQQIEDLQKAKGDFYKTVRDEHGKKTADALKLAVKISRMDTEKRSAAEEVDAEAFRILSIISKPRAPRATRAREEGTYADAQARELKALSVEQKREAVDWDEISRREYPDNSLVQVYFIEAPSLGLIKIGSTGMLDKRVAAIKRATPAPTELLGIISGGTKREVELHQKFAAHRVHGEWFAEAIRPEIDLLLAEKAIIEEFPVEHDEDGVFPDDEPQSAAAGSAGRADVVPVPSLPVESEAVAISTPIQPETANELPPASRGYAGADDLREPVATEQGQIAQEGDAPLEAAANANGEGMSGHAAYLSTDLPETAHEVVGGVASACSAIIMRRELDVNASENGVTGGESAATKPMYAAPGVITIQQNGPEPMVAHPYATCWPVNSIDVTDCVREPIVKIGPLILDGRGRYLAARRTHTGPNTTLEYPTVQYDGTDPLADCIRWNMASRTISGMPLRTVAHKLCKLEPERAEEILDLMGLAEQNEAAQ